MAVRPRPRSHWGCILEIDIDWQEGPGEKEGRRTWQITRTPTNGTTLKCAILSDFMMMCRTHWRGRTVPCLGKFCECFRKPERREFKAYFFAVQHKTNKRLLVEVTAAACNVLKDVIRERCTLKRTEIELSRTNNKPNGPVHCKVSGMATGAVFIEDFNNLKDVLYTLWRFDADTVGSRQLKQAFSETQNNVHHLPAEGSIVAATEKVSRALKGRRKSS